MRRVFGGRYPAVIERFCNFGVDFSEPPVITSKTEETLELLDVIWPRPGGKGSYPG